MHRILVKNRAEETLEEATRHDALMQAERLIERNSRLKSIEDVERRNRQY